MTVALVAAGAAAIVAAAVAGGQPARPRPDAGPAAEAPEEGVAYLLGPPEKGLQTVVILRVEGPDRVQAAFLQPVTLRLRNLGPGGPLAGHPAADRQAAVEALAGGRLAVAALRGRRDSGEVDADLWLGKGGGWLSEAAAGRLGKGK